MKIHNVVVFLLSILAIVFIIYNYVSQKAVSYNRANIQYANRLTAACHDAAKTISFDEDGTVWSDKEKINETLRVFYTCLSSAFHMDNSPMMGSIAEKTPFVILVDRDGFYLSVNACFDEYGNYVVPDEIDRVNSITTLNTWTETYAGNIVRFYLDDEVEVTLADYGYFTGTREEVFAALTDAGRTAGLEFLGDKEQFAEARITAITNRIEDTINYILNTQTVNVDSYNTGYNVTLPRLSGEDWSRMIKNPTVISFLQGKQQVIGTRIHNIYAYASGELTRSYPYFIVDGEYVWTRRALTRETTEDGSTVYTYMGVPVTQYYGSMKACAEKGAVPATR